MHVAVAAVSIFICGRGVWGRINLVVARRCCGVLCANWCVTIIIFVCTTDICILVVCLINGGGHFYTYALLYICFVLGQWENTD